MLTPLIYLLLALVVVAIAAVVIDKRNFIFGSLLIFSLLLTVMALYLKLAGYVLDKQIPVMNVLVILLPIVVIAFAIFWLVRNTNIISHKEGKSFTAKLALFLAVTMGIDFYLLFLTGEVHGRWLFFCYVLGLLVYNTFFLLFLSYLGYSLLYQVLPATKKADYIIVLGSYIHNGRVTPLLQSRVDRALTYYRQAAEGKRPKFVVSGGRGSDESTSEADAMRTYLLEVGVPVEDIILEDQSRNTFENFMFSKEKILTDWQKSGHTGQPQILFSTSNYHVMRASLYSKRIGFSAQGIGAPTSLYFLPTALIREYVGILSYYRLITFLLLVVEAFLAYMIAF
ncbi:YdcF family protein [Fructobacillus evanidus]